VGGGRLGTLTCTQAYAPYEYSYNKACAVHASTPTRTVAAAVGRQKMTSYTGILGIPPPGRLINNSYGRMASYHNDGSAARRV
jgi:hypothetical protein